MRHIEMEISNVINDFETAYSKGGGSDATVLAFLVEANKALAMQDRILREMEEHCYELGNLISKLQ